MSFDVSEPDNPSPIDPEEIQSKTFSSAWKGYRIEEVRSYLAHLSGGVRKLVSDLESANAKAEELSVQGRQSGESMAERVLKAEETAAQILRDANEAARALRDQARTYFEATRTRAEEEARELMERATDQTRLLSSQGLEGHPGIHLEESAKRELEQARVKAAEMIEQSKAEGRAMIDQARDLRNQILADLRHKRAVLDSEIADLATRRIEAYQSLARAVQLISEAGTIIVSPEPDVNQFDEEFGRSEPRASDDRLEAGPDAKDVSEILAEDKDGSLDGDVEQPRSSLDSSEGYQAKLAISNVEIGGHLEEGIVRVFYKESDKRADPIGEQEAAVGQGNEGQREAPHYREQEQPKNESLAFNVEPARSDDSPEPGVGHDAIGVEQGSLENLGDAGQLQTNATEDVDAGIEPVPATAGLEEFDGGSELVAATDVQEDSEIPPGVQEPVLEISGADQEKMQERPAIAGAQARAPESERSRKADEILARIRSLRIGENLGNNSPETVHLAGSAADRLLDPLQGDGDESVEVVKISGTPLNAEHGQAHEAEESTAGIGPGESDYEAEEPGSEVLAPEPDAATLELLDAREEILAPNASMLFKKVKRLLSDEQNDLLDKVRRSSGSKVVLDDLLDEKEQIDAVALASLDFFEQVRLGVVDLFSESKGAPSKREISRHAVECSEEFAKELVLPLRRRIHDALVLDITAEDQSTASALGSIYRDIRSNRLEQLISQYVNTVFCATILHESGYESFIWVTDPEDTPCADCLDNSLAGATIRGEQFPTGHLHPGIHSGCRCLLVPFIA